MCTLTMVLIDLPELSGKSSGGTKTMLCKVQNASPGGLVSKIRHSHSPGPGLFPNQGTTPPVCWLSYCRGCMLLWCWKLCHWYFKYRESHPWWTSFSRASTLERLRKKDLATHFQKNWLWKPCEKQQSIVWQKTRRWERMVQKDWAGRSTEMALGKG